MIRLDTQGRQIDDLTKEVKGKHGMQEQVELVQEQAYDTMYTVPELGSSQEKMLREISWLRDYVVKLEFRINVQEKQILDLKAHSLENNIIINGIDEKHNFLNIFEKELELDKVTVENLQINSFI